MDAITLEVLRNRFFAIAEEMGAALIRTAYSPNIKDRRDCSCALFDREGNTIAQAEHIPVHSGVLPWGVKGALEYIDVDALVPGDVVMHNDPFIGGTHLPDVIVISPLFAEGRVVAFVANLAHHVDVGGKVPASLSPDATEVFQEGLRWPPVKIQKAGVLDPELLAIHHSNVRTPHEGKGDLLAQIASNNVGQKRWDEVVEEFGLEVVLEGITELDSYCDRRMRVELERLPVGTFSFSDTIEGDGVVDDLLEIKVTITTGGPQLLVDFTGTCPQTKGPLNCVRPMTLACIYYVIRAITDPTIPPNSGTFRGIDVITPSGSLVNAKFPSPTGMGNAISTQRIVDVLLGAFAQMLPERATAAAAGAMNGVQMGSFNPVTEQYFTYGETYGGGYGASRRGDGTSGVQSHMTNTRNTPIEVLESILPVRVWRYGLVSDSEGAGEHRGGFGIARVVEMLQDDVSVYVMSDRAINKPWGLESGQPASGPSFTVTNAAGSRRLGTKSSFVMNTGDVLSIETSGGGGWGDPLRRDRDALDRDVRGGLISPERARAVYGLRLPSTSAGSETTKPIQVDEADRQFAIDQGRSPR
ncbi:MAG: hydantoinase B/oxoprolinase family protein [Propionicimonas sp.]